jgi:hypothetical protein
MLSAIAQANKKRLHPPSMEAKTMLRLLARVQRIQERPEPPKKKSMWG